MNSILSEVQGRLFWFWEVFKQTALPDKLRIFLGWGFSSL